MAPPSFSDSPIAPSEAMVAEDGIVKTDTRHASAMDTDGTKPKDETVIHSGSSPSEPREEFQEGGYGW